MSIIEIGNDTFLKMSELLTSFTDSVEIQLRSHEARIIL